MLHNDAIRVCIGRHRHVRYGDADGHGGMAAWGAEPNVWFCAR